MKVNWQQTNNIISCILGLVTLGQLGSGIVKNFDDGIPVWLFVTCSISCLVFGYLVRIWRDGRAPATYVPTGGLKELGQVKFDYLPALPTGNGWRLGYDGALHEGERYCPRFSAAVDAPVNGGLTVEPKERYFMDYDVEQVHSLANVVKYYVKPIRSGTVYLRILVSSQDGEQQKTVWLQHVIGKKPPRKINGSEWSFDVQGEMFKHGWVGVEISIEDEVRQSFGREGFVYRCLQGVRLRGSLSISAITLYQKADETCNAELVAQRELMRRLV
jgi:hypothetical protein